MTDEKDLTPSKGISLTEKPLDDITGDPSIKEKKTLLVVGGVSGPGKSTIYMDMLKYFRDNPLGYDINVLSDAYEDMGKRYPEEFEQLCLGEWKSPEERLLDHHSGKSDPNALRQRFNRNGGKW